MCLFYKRSHSDAVLHCWSRQRSTDLNKMCMNSTINLNVLSLNVVILLQCRLSNAIFVTEYEIQHSHIYIPKLLHY